MTAHEGIIALISPPQIVDKLWGREEIIANLPEYCGKILHLRPGFMSSRHYHKLKKETFFVYEGHVSVELGGSVHHLGPRESITIIPNTPHSFWTRHMGAIIIETSTHHSDDDVVRLTESHKLPEVT